MQLTAAVVELDRNRATTRVHTHSLNGNMSTLWWSSEETQTYQCVGCCSSFHVGKEHHWLVLLLHIKTCLRVFQPEGSMDIWESSEQSSTVKPWECSQQRSSGRNTVLYVHVCSRATETETMRPAPTNTRVPQDWAGCRAVTIDNWVPWTPGAAGRSFLQSVPWWRSSPSDQSRAALTVTTSSKPWPLSSLHWTEHPVKNSHNFADETRSLTLVTDKILVSPDVTTHLHRDPSYHSEERTRQTGGTGNQGQGYVSRSAPNHWFRNVDDTSRQKWKLLLITFDAADHNNTQKDVRDKVLTFPGCVDQTDADRSLNRSWVYLYCDLHHYRSPKLIKLLQVITLVKMDRPELNGIFMPCFPGVEYCFSQTDPK